jgi:CHASE2 domain-containing sensor protein
MQPLISKQTYQSSALMIFIGTTLIGAFFASRPAFSFLPYGLSLLGAFILGLVLVFRTRKRKRYLRWEFQIFSICSAVVCGYLIAESVAHLLAGQNTYYVRPLLAIPITLIFWLGEKWEYHF